MTSGSGSAAVDERVSRVVEKLRLTAQSGAASPTARVGMPNDPYVLRPPLAPDQVAEFEERHGVRLPEAYRRFLLEVGDGDPGDGGLYSLDQGYEELVLMGYLPDPDVDDEADPPPLDEQDDDVSFLARPSPYRRDETYTVGWWEDNYGPGERLDQLHGTLPVQEGGCSEFSFLVVTGPDAGAVYSANWDGGHAPIRVGDDYLTWYEDNLDARALISADRWDESLAGREAQLVEVLTGDPHEYRRMWAAVSLRKRRRWRRPSDRARQALEAAFEDEHYVVRAAALGTASRRRIASLAPAVQRTLDDRFPEVRYRAVLALEDFDHPELATVARGALGDSAKQLREWAVELLHQRNALTTDDLAGLLDDPEWTVRRAAMHALPDIDDPDGTLLAKALFDDESTVRSMAIDQIIERDDPALTALLSQALVRETDYSVTLKLELATGQR